MERLQPIDVVAGLIFRHGRVLACRRRAGAAFPLKWEFPGGKVEPGENSQTALIRELREELAIEVEDMRPVFSHTHAYPDFPRVRLNFFYVPAFRGTLANRVFEEIRWVAPAELISLDFLEGDRPILQWLSSPDGETLWRSGEV